MDSVANPVRSLGRDEQDRAISVIVAAFTRDPITRWVYPDAHQYLTYFPLFLSAWISEAFDRDMAFMTASGDGVAIWMPPGTHADEETMGNIMMASLRDENRDEVLGFAAAQGNNHPDFEHLYLPFIAVDPAKQGNGVGSILLDHSLDICDRIGLPAYLEATSPASRRLYERYGFAATGEIQFGSSPPMWPMLRQVRKA